jgi:nucleoside-diphosphate-sugar epimerase
MALELAGGGHLEVCPKDSDYPSRGSLNIDAARQDFNFNPKVVVEEGFQNYYNWLKKSEYYAKNNN